jgi:hypothetical protein
MGFAMLFMYLSNEQEEKKKGKKNQWYIYKKKRSFNVSTDIETL